MSFEQVLRFEQIINTLSRSLVGRDAFDRIHVLFPNPERPESGFLRATSWLYCLYFEGGRVSIRYLCSLGYAWKLIDKRVADDHIESIRCLRTELHHNLGFEDSDKMARNIAEQWRKQSCGTSVPQSDEQWFSCYEHLISSAVDLLKNIERVLRKMEADGSDAENHIEEWRIRLDKNWPAANFDRLVEDVKYRLEMPALDTIAFRNRHVQRWRKALMKLDDSFDFDREATLLIEKVILDELGDALPITGRDIIECLQVKPGPLIGKLLVEARHFIEAEGRCKSDQLLEHLREHLEHLRDCN